MNTVLSSVDLLGEIAKHVEDARAFRLVNRDFHQATKEVFPVLLESKKESPVIKYKYRLYSGQVLCVSTTDFRPDVVILSAYTENTRPSKSMSVLSGGGEPFPDVTDLESETLYRQVALAVMNNPVHQVHRGLLKLAEPDMKPFYREYIPVAGQPLRRVFHFADGQWVQVLYHNPHHNGPEIDDCACTRTITTSWNETKIEATVDGNSWKHNEGLDMLVMIMFGGAQMRDRLTAILLHDQFIQQA